MGIQSNTLGASYMYLLRILISSFCCLHLLWLAREISLVLVLRHSIGNRSNAACDEAIRRLCFLFQSRATAWLFQSKSGEYEHQDETSIWENDQEKRLEKNRSVIMAFGSRTWCPSTILAGHECERTDLSSIHARIRARYFRARLQSRDLRIRALK